MLPPGSAQHAVAATRSPIRSSYVRRDYPASVFTMGLAADQRRRKPVTPEHPQQTYRRLD
jgi:hypothetical protein